ncbi:MAG TPA: molybdenum cofactor guanylyltransferase [Chthoniobacterales bacterium]|nr:molybdenum cofactor guanylyltransferase [Chthoniobacterales bacterium]
MSSRFSELLLAGGRSTRMGTDKAFVELNGVPLWRRQLQLLEELHPHELFIAGPAHEEWQETNGVIISDAEPNAGPLAGIVAALKRCSAQLLLVIAVDLPHISSRYLSELLDSCAADRGAVPSYGERCEPLAAVYPRCSLSLGERCLASRDLSVQRFAARCVSEGLAIEKEITADERPLFLNMNTPDDLLAASDA